MKHIEFFIFFGIVIIIYSAINYYIFARGAQALPSLPWFKISYNILFGFLFSSFIIHVILVRLYPSSLCSIFTWSGFFWMGAMMYFFLGVLLIDIFRLVNHFFPFFPEFLYKNYSLTKQITAGIMLLGVLITLITGYINASYPQLKHLNITINKKVGGLNKLRIVAASDIHLGSIINKKDSQKLVDRINALNPDLILFPGDILDESVEPVLKFKSDEPFKNLKSKYGVFAVTGNHEYISGIGTTAPHLESLGISLLQDSVALINNEIYIVGRKDRASKQFAKQNRKPLDEIMNGIDKTKPIILMDHQPIGLGEAEQNGVDFQLSGHTHHGQLWPISYITNKIYEVSWCYLKKGNTQYYISSGYGTWGPPVRIGNHPELLLIELEFGE
ncbi:MAG: metallophosphoesterase [bacterium]